MNVLLLSYQQHLWWLLIIVFASVLVFSPLLAALTIFWSAVASSLASISKHVLFSLFGHIRCGIFQNVLTAVAVYNQGNLTI